MAKNLPTVQDDDAPPAYLVQYEDDLSNEEFGAPGGLPIGVVSIRGSKWKGRYQGEEVVLRDQNGYAQPFFDCILVKGALGKEGLLITSKTYYQDDFVEGSDAAPDCSSSNGIVPDAASPHIQSPTCGECQWNKWNTARRGKGKRCQDNRRFAILPADDLVNEKLGGPMLLRIPPGSFQTLDEYRADCNKRGRKIAAGVTRMSFDPEAAYPRILFSWAGWLAEEEVAAVMAWRQDAHVERILNISQSELGTPVREAVEEEEATEAAPAPAQATAQERVAAARAAAAVQRPAAAVAPRPAPRPAPVAAARPAPTPAPAPAARVVAKAPVTGRVVPMRTPAPAPAPAAETPLEAKRRKAAEAIAEARRLAAELAEEESGEAATDAAAEEEAPFDEATGEDGIEDDEFLGELDAQVGTIPD